MSFIAEMSLWQNRVSQMYRAKIHPDKKRYNRVEEEDFRYYYKGNPEDAEHAQRWDPSEPQRAAIMRMAGIGLPVDQIAKIVGVSPRLLIDRCTDDMDLGYAQVNALYLNKFFEKIMKEGNTSLLMFYLSRKLGWVEPANAGVAIPEDLRELSDEQLQAELRALSERRDVADSARGLYSP